MGKLIAFMTNEERIKQLNTKELAQELALIATWDREQLKKAENGPGIEQFMQEWLEKPFCLKKNKS